MMRTLMLALLFLLGALAGCTNTVDETVAPPTETSNPGTARVVTLATTGCYVFANIPFTDVGWPDQYLPPAYTSADASTVWGFPVNLQFSALGVLLAGCEGESASDAWQIGLTQIMVEPPAVEGVEPVHATSQPSPMTAEDGGFNMYAPEWYASGALYDHLEAWGWNVHNKTMDVTLPNRLSLPDTTGPTYYATGGIRAEILDETGTFGWMANSHETVWNHRNFEFQLYTETAHGTGVMSLVLDNNHLLVGQADCEFAAGTLPHELYSTMPYLGPARQRTNGDCPDDALGALWLDAGLQVAQLQDHPGVFAR